MNTELGIQPAVNLYRGEVPCTDGWGWPYVQQGAVGHQGQGPGGLCSIGLSPDVAVRDQSALAQGHLPLGPAGLVPFNRHSDVVAGGRP